MLDSALTNALGGLGLFLLGMAVMTDALESLAGGRLSAALERFTSSPLSGAMTGATTTAVIQSSSATSVAAIGFVGAGLLTFPQALGILFGANVGTTLTGWLVALFGFKLSITAAALPLVLVGVLVRILGPRRLARFGLVIAGFALVFLGIGLLQEGMRVLEGSVTPADFPPDTWGGRGMCVAIGALLTLVTQSSSAGVATALAAVSTGTISFGQAAAMVIGMDVGTTFTALIACVGGSTAARRTGVSHVVYNVLTGIGAYLLLPLYTTALERLNDVATREPELSLVAFHSLFNGLGVLVALPFTSAFARKIEALIPDRETAVSDRLDPRLLADPAVALDACATVLSELASQGAKLFEENLAGKVRGDELDNRLRPLRRELEAAREYLDEIVSPPDDARTSARHQAAILALDHIERSGNRLRRRPAPQAVQQDPLAESRRAKLRTALRSWDSSTPEERQKELQELWRGFDAQRHDERRETLARAARNEVDVDDALALLDEMRRLRRLAYHGWRTSHHLRRAVRKGILAPFAGS